MVGSVPDHRADGVSAKCPESLCPNAGVTPIGETCLPSPQRTLLLLPRSYGLMRQSQQALLYFGYPSLDESVQVVNQSLLPTGPSRRYLRESFLGCLIPYPGGPTACICLFLPLCHRPSPTMAWVGFPRVIRSKRLRAGLVFRGGRYSFTFRPPSLRAPQVVPTAAHTAAGQLELLRPGISCFVTSARTGYVNRPDRQLTVRGLTPR